MTGERLIFKGAFDRCAPEKQQWLTDEIVTEIMKSEFWKLVLQKYYDLGKHGWTLEKANEFVAFIEFCYRQEQAKNGQAVVYNETHE